MTRKSHLFTTKEFDQFRKYYFMKILSINKLKGLRLYIHNISEYRKASLYSA